MTTYLTDLADALVPDVTLGPTDAGICASALRVLDMLIRGVAVPGATRFGDSPVIQQREPMSDLREYVEQFNALAVAAKAREAAGEDDGAMRVSMREIIESAMGTPYSPVNVSDRWKLLVGAVMVFGIADHDVARLSLALGVEAEGAAAA